MNPTSLQLEIIDTIRQQRKLFIKVTGEYAGSLISISEIIPFPTSPESELALSLCLSKLFSGSDPYVTLSNLRTQMTQN